MDDLLRDLDARAATIDELLSDRFLVLPGEKNDADRAAARLAAWCRASASGDWRLFARRLARDGLGVEAVLSRFATVRRNPLAPPPTWLPDAGWIARALTAGSPPHAPARLYRAAEPIAFESLLAGVVDAAERRLGSGLGTAGGSTITDEALQELSRALLRQLSALSAPALFDAFAARTPANREPIPAPASPSAGPAGTAQFDAFLEHLREGGLARLFAAKPVLLRLLVVTTRQWIDSTQEFLARLASDVADVRATLLGRSDPSPVVSVRGGLSDMHNLGRSVLLVQFQDGRRVLYKPKDVRPDTVWHELVAWLNALGAPVALRSAGALARAGYGWTEFVEHTPCPDRAGVARFYERAGAWLALFHVFAAADMHLENVIAAGDQPVPIDLEMILQAGDRAGDDGVPERAALEQARQRIAESVTAVGLLPAYARSPDNAVVGLGGLNESRKRITEPGWEHPNTDSMRPVLHETVLQSLPNIPSVDGAPVPLVEFTGALRAGFDRYGRFLADHRERLIAHGWFDRLAGLPIRRLLKPTRFYLLLLERLRDHRTMGDGAAWSANLEFMARLVDWDRPEDRLWPLFRAERDALADLNVPYFLTTSDGVDVADRAGIVAHDREETGLARALSRLRRFDRAEVDWQSRILDVSISALPGAPRDEARRPAVVVTHEPSLLAGAQDAADRIAAAAIRSGPGAAWIGLDWLGDSDASQLVPLGFDLYNGAPGIALFLAAHARVTDDHAAADLARAGLAPVRSHLAGANAARFARGLGLGGASGLGSVVYALSAIGGLLGDHDLTRDALRAARLFTDELIESDQVYDVIGGSAGGILGLLEAHRSTGDSDVLARATRCGEHLLRARGRDGRDAGMWPALGTGVRPLTGMSHGAAGFAYALGALHRATGREDFAAAARDCLEFEDRWYSADRGNWPDLRREDPAWPCQWCYGAGGIGLARIAMARRGHADSTTLDADIARAVRCVERAWPSPLDTLCCGSLGNIECLDEAGRFLGSPRLREEARRRAGCLLAEAQATGDYRWGGGGGKQFNLGLFRGLAGVGYTMLRRLSPDLPSVLTWE